MALTNSRRLRRPALLGATGIAVLAALTLLLAACGRSRDALTPDERAWLRRHDGQLVVAPELEEPPHTFVDGRGVWRGIAVDYIRLIEQRLGFHFRIARPKPFAEILRDAREGRVDVVTSITETPERLQYLRYTSPYINMQILILVRPDTPGVLQLEDLRGRRTGVTDGYAVTGYLREHHPEVSLVPVRTELDGLRRLAAGEYDAMLSDATVAYYFQRENSGRIRVAGEVPFAYHLGFATRRSEPMLHRIMQRGLDLITPAERAAIWSRWIPLSPESVPVARRPFFRDPSFWRLVLVVVAAVGLVVGAVVAWNSSLHAQVRARTAEIAEARRRAAFLAEASATLAEAALEYEETLTRLGNLSLRFPADWCGIDVREGDQIRRVAGTHADPAKKPLLDALAQRYPARPEGPSPGSTVLRTGQPLVVADLSDEALRSMTEDAAHADLLRALGTRTMLAVPLVARGSLVGVLTLASGAPGRRFGPADLTLAQGLARRVAVAIDNARLYRVAQEAIHARDVFLSVASHELRTPLTVLGLRCGRLARSIRSPVGGIPRPEGLAQELAGIERQLQRLEALNGQLLDASQLRAGPVALRRETCDLGQVVRDVAEDFRDDVARSGSELVLALDADAVGCWDRVKLEQVVTNLLSNAIKFGEGREIVMRIAVTPDRVTLTLQDHGIGMDPAASERVFREFERAVSARNYPGLGLGLYIARQIVEAHGGAISMRSALGHGSTLAVDLPRGPRVECTHPPEHVVTG